MGRPKPSPTPVSLSDDDDSIEDSDLEINEEEVVKASRGRGTTQLLDTPSFQRGMARANDSVDELAILGSMGRSSTAAGHVRHTVAGIEARGQSALEAKPNRIGAMKVSCARTGHCDIRAYPVQGKMGAAGPAAPNRTVSKRTQDEVNPLAEPWRTIELPVAELFIGLQPYPLGSSRWKCMLDNKCISLIKDERPTLQVHLEKLKDIEVAVKGCVCSTRLIRSCSTVVEIASLSSASWFVPKALFTSPVTTLSRERCSQHVRRSTISPRPATSELMACRCRERIAGLHFHLSCRHRQGP
jgi:hypothetical protein